MINRRQIMRARYRQGGIAPIGKSFASDFDSRMGAFFAAGGGRWNNSSLWELPSRDALDAIAKAHPIVKACIAEIATTIAEPQLRIGREVDGEFVENENDENIRLLENPNLDHTGTQLIQFITSSLVVHGVAYIQKKRGLNGAGKVRALYYWPASWVTEQPAGEGSDSPVAGYTVLSRNVLPEDMIRIWLPSVDHPWDPCSPLAAAYNDVRMDQEASNYHSEMVGNLSACGLAINMGPRTTPDQRSDAELAIASRFGRGNRGKPYIFGGEGADVKLVSPMGDLDWPGVSSACETRICAALGVPPIIIGARAGLDRATYSNYELALKSYYSETAGPLWAAISDALTRSLLRAENIQNLEFRFEVDSLPAMQESADDLSLRIISQKSNGIISVNEARTALGFDPLGPEHDELSKPGMVGLFGSDPPAEKKPDFDDEDGEDDK